MFKTHFQALLFLAVCLRCLCAHASDISTEPAQLANAAEVEQLIQFPAESKNGERVIIRLGTTVSRGGGIEPIIYFDATKKAQFKPYEDEIRKAIRNLRITPALLNGRTVPVWMNFSVIFDSMQTPRHVMIVPNFEYDVTRHGERYSDPQRMETGRIPRGCIRRSAIWTLSIVEARGTAASAAILSGKASKHCEIAFEKFLLQSTYIPARRDNSNVAGPYVEAWFASP